VGFAYWGLYALVAPVTNIDSQMYNIARLDLAMKGGLFKNDFFTSVYQVMWPWTFDAVYLPFVQLGWGYALPSFCCLAGACVVVFIMTRVRFGPDAAWVALLGLLGLTCLVYQGTSTKNDIPILFAGAVWVYARWRWQREGKGVHIFWMVLAIGFMAGAKTTGVLYGIILALWTLWEFRGSRKRVLRIAAGLLGAFILFGSVETYLESARLLGNPLGPPENFRQSRNPDGIRGGIANLSRFVVGSIYVGPTTYRSAPAAVSNLAGAEETFLSWTGTTGAGFDRRYPRRTLFFFQSGFEELSGFGPIGTIAMATMLFACLRWRPGAVWWRLAAAAFLGLVLMSLTVAYTDWANRYLISWYTLATVAVVCALWERETPFRRMLRWGFAAMAAASAIAAPLLSFNRRPADIIASVRDRDRFETCAFPLAGKVRARLRILSTEAPNRRLYFIAGNDSVELPILEDRSLDVIFVTPPEFLRLAGSGRIGPGDLVVEDIMIHSPLLTRIEEVSAPDMFSENTTRTEEIFRVSRMSVPLQP